MLCEEIDSYRSKKYTLDTVFFGGGTPSLLSGEEMKKIISHINESFELAPGSEMTVEANPGTLIEESLKAYVASGVNRISLGLQSIHENEQKILGRIHNYDEFLSAYDMVKRSGIDNISVDLMYAIPEQTLNSFEKTLDAVIELSPPHISLYSLIIEEGTPFYRLRDGLPLPTEDEEISMYSLAAAKLRDGGYSHYEISNYARPGWECRHNLKYWQDEEYIGVGLAAHSYLEGVRYSNTERLDGYISSFREGRIGNRIPASEEAFEYAMLALRLSRGLSLADFEERFSYSFLKGREKKIEALSSAGLMKKESDRIFLTERGFYVSNSILAELL